MATTLERIDLAVGPSDELAEACKAELGYGALRTATPSKKLVACLKAVGVRPFKREQVTPYLNARKKEANGPSDRPWNRGWLAALALCVFVPPTIALMTSTLCLLTGWFLLPILLMAYLCLADERPRWEWRWRKLEDYTQPVPAYALQLALDLRRELKAAGLDHTFWVYELAREETTGDPFLCLGCEGRTEWLEVWDEPGFGGKRTV